MKLLKLNGAISVGLIYFICISLASAQSTIGEENTPSLENTPTTEPEAMPTQSPTPPSANTETKSSTPTSADQNLVFEANSEYRYEPVGKRDPFRPYRETKIGIGDLRTSSRPREPLESFDARVLQVVAIIWGNEKPRALIQDPDNQVHAVIKGQRIGKNEGFVAEIREGEIVIVEMFDFNGKIVKETLVLPMKK